MASIIVTQGLRESARLTAGTGGTAYNAMAWDNATGAGNTFLAAHTKLNDRAGATAFQANAEDSGFPSTTGAGVTPVVNTFQSTLLSTQFNGNTIGRVSLHNVAAGSVSLSSATLMCGIDTQSIAKDNTFSLITVLSITYSSV